MKKEEVERVVPFSPLGVETKEKVVVVLEEEGPVAGSACFPVWGGRGERGGGGEKGSGAGCVEELSMRVEILS